MRRRRRRLADQAAGSRRALNLRKNTGIATVIGAAAPMMQAPHVESAGFRSFEAFALVTLAYLPVFLLLTGQALRSVLLPQALRHMLPSLINQFVATIKETSLGTIIGLAELRFIANPINAQVLVKPVEIYLTLAGCYFAMCFGLTRAAKTLERRLAT